MAKESRLEGIKRANLWRRVIVKDVLKSVDGNPGVVPARAFICEDDREVLSTLVNKKSFQKEAYRFHFELPPEPWQGNPLKAKVIILTLNPGYVYRSNTISARLLKMAGYAESIAGFKSRVLRLKEDSMMPPQMTKIDKKAISLFDAFNTLGDWYWVDKLRELREAYIERRKNENGRISVVELENEFYKKIAVVEYCAYTSQSFSDSKLIEDLPSVKYVKEMIRQIESEGKALFVILRAERKWGKVLKDKSRCIVNTNLSQNLSKKNLNSKKGVLDKGIIAPFDVILDRLLEK